MLILVPPLFAGASEKAKLDSIRVNFEAHNLPMREALQHLIAQTNLQIVYHDALIKDLSVSCACNNVTLREALEILLKPAMLTFEVMKDGQIVIVARKVDLKGYVKAAESGEALPYANVAIKGESRKTISNVNGYFVFVDVPAGLCTLRVSYIGYEAAERSLALADGQQTFLIDMKPRILPGAAVVVSGDHLQTVEVAQDASVLGFAPQQAARLPSVGEVDILRSLQLLPGISSASDVSSGLYVRGGTPDQNLVLFDGMTIYHADHFFGFSSAFNTDAIKDVRVFKGGFPAKFGGRISSIVELTGKSGSYDKFQIGGNVNLLSGSGIVQVPIAGRGAWLLSYRRSYTDFIKSDLYKDIYSLITRPPQPNDSHRGASQSGEQTTTITPDFYYHDLISKLSYSLSGRNILSMSYCNSQDNLDQSRNLDDFASNGNSSKHDSMSAPASGNEVTRWGNRGASGKWSRLWNDRLYSSLLAAYSVYSSESRGLFEMEINPNNFMTAANSSESNEVKDFSLQWENEWHTGASHKFEFGVEFNRTNVEVSFTANDTIRFLLRDDDASQSALYLQDTWRVLAPLELTLGTRAINYAPTKKNYFEPRASFKLSLTERLSMKGAYGEYHQFVNRITNDDALNGNRDFWLLADEKLAPSFAEHKILGLTYENRDYLLDVEAYHKNLDGVAEFSQRFRRPEQPEGLFFLGNGVAKGVEFLAQKKSGRLNGWASYALAKVDYRIPGLNQGKPFPANQDRRHEFKLAGNYTSGKWNFSTTWIYSSGAPFTAPASEGMFDRGKNANRLPSYHRLDVSCSRQLTFVNMDWELGLSIFNLYDRRNVLRREFFQNGNSVAVRDVTTLGFTPTATLKVNLK